MEANGVPGKLTVPHVIAKKSGRATIYRVARTKAGKTYVEYRVAVYGTDGRRQVTSVSDLNLAVEVAEKKLAALGRGLVDTTVLSGPDRLDYLFAKKLLGANVSLADAARAWTRSQEGIQTTPITVEALVDAFIKSREVGTRRGKRASEAYLIDLRRRLAKLTDAFRCDVTNVSMHALEAWIDATGQTGRNRFNTLRLVRTLLKWAQKRGHLPDGSLPTDKLEISAPADDGIIDIFTPAELGRLLNAAKPEMVPYLALGAFAGCRTAETVRLDWADIKLERGFVEVGAAKAKTAARRLIPVLPALAAWLAPIRQASGPVLPFLDIGKQVSRLCRAAGVTWKINALRHSFISYRVASLQDVAQVALEAGNSPAMIFAHYRELVTPDEAKAWFAVLPPPANIVTPSFDSEATKTQSERG